VKSAGYRDREARSSVLQDGEDVTFTQIELGDITVDVVFKDIKNVHLSVHRIPSKLTGNIL